MAKVTSKLQVTVPKALAERFRIRPGDEIAWEAGSDSIRIVPARDLRPLSSADRLKLFDRATERQQQRRHPGRTRPADRGWTREELYERRRAR
jgi:AbrB family looped-hinge helix DNA binding protein